MAIRVYLLRRFSGECFSGDKLPTNCHVLATNCHPDRSFSFPKGMRSGVEGPAVQAAPNAGEHRLKSQKPGAKS
jgi:hypothetical protein